MTADIALPIPISTSRIFLDLSNPRHEPYGSEAEVIDYLCTKEFILELARDMAALGPNPLELFALVLAEKKKGRAANPSYVVVEGNRRLCAIKLLHDPDLAPVRLRRDFEKLSASSRKMTEVLGVVFADRDAAHVWFGRIHGGPQGGIGRRQWDTTQKARHLGVQKNAVALAVFDYAQRMNFISPQDRKGKLTTAQRYLSNPAMREAIGLDTSSLGELARTRPGPEFDLLLKTFLSDIETGKVNSRSDAGAVLKYSRELGMAAGATTTRTSPEPLANQAGRPRPKRAPAQPRQLKHIQYESEIAKALSAIPSYKLERIYYSICEISLQDHTPLLAVGTWMFFETLTALCGRNETTNFLAFLSKRRLATFGIRENSDVQAVLEAVARITKYGNATKHHETSANFSSEQLANDVDTLKALILHLAELAITTKDGGLGKLRSLTNGASNE